MGKKAYGWGAALFLLLGMGVYLCFRNTPMLLFAWVPKPAALDAWQVPLPPFPGAGFLRYNLAGALWLVSGVALLRCVWFEQPRWQRFYIICWYAIAAIMEISQLAPAVPGTFDLLDLISMGIGAFVEGLLYNVFIKRRRG